MYVCMYIELRYAADVMHAYCGRYVVEATCAMQCMQMHVMNVLDAMYGLYVLYVSRMQCMYCIQCNM